MKRLSKCGLGLAVMALVMGCGSGKSGGKLSLNGLMPGEDASKVTGDQAAPDKHVGFSLYVDSRSNEDTLEVSGNPCVSGLESQDHSDGPVDCFFNDVDHPLAKELEILVNGRSIKHTYSNYLDTVPKPTATPDGSMILTFAAAGAINRIELPVEFDNPELDGNPHWSAAGDLVLQIKGGSLKSSDGMILMVTDVENTELKYSSNDSGAIQPFWTANQITIPKAQARVLRNTRSVNIVLSRTRQFATRETWQADPSVPLGRVSVNSGTYVDSAPLAPSP